MTAIACYARRYSLISSLAWKHFVRLPLINVIALQMFILQKSQVSLHRPWRIDPELTVETRLRQKRHSGCPELC